VSLEYGRQSIILFIFWGKASLAMGSWGIFQPYAILLIAKKNPKKTPSRMGEKVSPAKRKEATATLGAVCVSED